MSQTVLFPPPEPARERRRIAPVFLPFSGCPQRCVFCAQDVQTGVARQSVDACLARAGALFEDMAARRESGGNGAREGEQKPFELAFYGGTFTALPEAELEACLAFAAHWRKRGLIGELRCSTRPDALSPKLVMRLSEAGFTCVELGVQSFSDKALQASQRGYDGEAARKACAMLSAMQAESGVALGIQLMPGMPGNSLEDAYADLRQSIAFKPACVRLYPCLVLEGTGLAGLWRAGRYRPWELDATTDFLADACFAFQQAGVAVIRMGLPEEPGLAAHVLAGPRHPSLGSIARSRALYLYLAERIRAFSEAGRANLHPLMEGGMLLPVGKFLQRASCESFAAQQVAGVADSRPLGCGAPQNGEIRRQDQGALRLEAPRRYQGEFWGHRGELAQRYAELGLARGAVSWRDDDFFALSFVPS